MRLLLKKKEWKQYLPHYLTHEQRIDLWSVDCEAHDLAVLRLPTILTGFQPRLLIVKDKGEINQTEIHR